ncbi:hypothetical protein Pcac1_g22841 [Phytophthora cactorum]|nr:hypothetical protein Pcac1_g22841 [Phytophthora cactorum]
MTRRKPKKHVRFANEHAEVVSKAHEQRGEVANESSFDERSSSHPSNTVPPATPAAEDIDPVAVQRERRRRIAAAQDEEKKWLNLKKVLRGQAEMLSYKEAQDAWKYADRFVLSEDVCASLPWVESSVRPCMARGDQAASSGIYYDDSRSLTELP